MFVFFLCSTYKLLKPGIDHVYFRSKVDTMDNWELENSPAIVVKIGETNLYASISSQREEKGKPIYWLAPEEFLGQKVHLHNICLLA